jgi:hypothetical protein
MTEIEAHYPIAFAEELLQVVGHAGGKNFDNLLTDDEPWLGHQYSQKSASAPS